MFARKDSSGPDRVTLGPKVVRFHAKEIGNSPLRLAGWPRPDLGESFDGDASSFCQHAECHPLAVNFGGDGIPVPTIWRNVFRFCHLEPRWKAACCNKPFSFGLVCDYSARTLAPTKRRLYEFSYYVNPLRRIDRFFVFQLWKNSDRESGKRRIN